MLIALLILTGLSMGLSAAALVLALVVWGGGRGGGHLSVGSADSSPQGEPTEEKKRPLDDERMREGIANLLSYQVGGKEGEE